ncbi:DUF6182 family protein [Amycolatopsis sp. H20-H5]|uniref:DUF6182 family protein n=1 Tax=Amycolatopsis sp. H20-H5 TaxID=3046309 RepID=UPI002DB98EAF|nr:DUF6182 family protein [Amycolatopsis sp. H20-H5]MEC3974976.1 DUF6182 family protein [Amycolatopsis sp. H20-H5]
MNLTQELLRAELARRVGAVRPDLAGKLDLSTIDGLFAAQTEIAGADPDSVTGVVSVLRAFDPAAWISETITFAATLTPAEADVWRTALTRTYFLAGNPANLVDRFRFAHVADDGNVAWTAPVDGRVSLPLRRLLKLLEAPAPLPHWRQLDLAVPGGPKTGRTRGLYIATAGATVARSLVHLNHLLVEAVFDGLVAGGDQLQVRQVPRLLGVPSTFVALRVAADPGNPHLLRAFAGLTKEVPLAR